MTSRRGFLAGLTAPAFTRLRWPRQDAVPPGRERLLLDFNWRFALGHADDPARDFGFGRGEAFGKVGHLFDPVSRRDFDESAWHPVNLPHDWAVDLPF